MHYCNAMHGTALPRHLDVRDLKCNRALLQCNALHCAALTPGCPRSEMQPCITASLPCPASPHSAALTAGCPRSEMQPCITALQRTASSHSATLTAGCPRSEMQPCITAGQCTALHCPDTWMSEISLATVHYCNAMHGTALP